MKRIPVLALALALALAWAAPSLPCTSVLVGKAKSAEGAVLLAHNEELGENLAQKVVQVPARTQKEGARMPTVQGAAVPRPARTNGYLAVSVYDKSRIPGDLISGVSDAFLAVANNNAYLRGHKDYDATIAFTRPSGLVFTELSQIVLERATSAREAILFLGGLIQEHGLHRDSGTMLAIADKNEGWWMEIAGTGQWIARRVPDDAAEMRANCYRIGPVNLDDAANILHSPDVVSYAVSRGWHDPASGRPFSFADAYGEPAKTESGYNTLRHRRVEAMLAQSAKVSVPDLFRILRDDMEGEPEYEADESGSPFHGPHRTVARSDTEASVVNVLDARRPVPIGARMWLALSNPAFGVFVPFHLGDRSLPPAWTRASGRYSQDSAYWLFTELHHLADLKYSQVVPGLRKTWRALEASFLAGAAKAESEAARKARAGRMDEALKGLTAFDRSCADKALAAAREMLVEVKTVLFFME